MNPWIDLLRPHKRLLTFALLAAIGEAITDIAQPWPLKIVLDNVLHQFAPQDFGTRQTNRRQSVTQSVTAIEQGIRNRADINGNL